LAALASDFEAHMVAPYNYAIQTPSAFESLVSGLKLGTSLQEMQAQQQLRQAQAEQIQQKMEAERQRQTLLQDFYSKAKSDQPLTSEDWLRFGEASNSENYRKLAADRVQAIPEEQQRAYAGWMGQTIVALWKTPKIGLQQIKDRLAANPTDKGLQTILEMAEVDPKAAAVGMYGMGAKLGKNFEDVFKNVADTLGMKPEEAAKDPEDIRTMRLLGLSITPETYEKFKQAGQRPEAGSALQKAQAYRQTLIAQGKRDTPEFEENQRYINNLLVDPSAQTAAQIEANRIAQARLDQVERINSPEYQAALAEAKARGTATGQAAASKEAEQRAAVSVLKSIGYNAETGEDDVSKAIAASTSGGAQADIAAIMRYFGGTTKGMQAIGKLQTVASRLTTEILGGRLGAGISNTDREFILQGLGNIGDPTLTASERLAGWTSARNRMVQVGILPAGRSAQPQQPVAPEGGAKPVTEMSNEEILRRLRGQ